MKKEQAFEAMKNGAKIAHISWKDGSFIREIDGRIGDERGLILKETRGIEMNGWFIVGETDSLKCYQAEQLLKSIPLHLEDPNRVWCYSGHEAEPAIAKAMRELHDEVKRLRK